MDNNIFKFATKELSQDAFLCWCINWVNQTSNSVLYDLGADVLKTMLFNELYKNKLKELKNDLERANVHINIIRQFNITTYDNKKENKNRMDIVLTIKAKKENYVVIIEDKIDSKLNINKNGVNQLKRYKKAMEKLLKGANNKTKAEKIDLLGLSSEDCKNSKVIPVLVKTGELTAYEKNLGYRIVDASKLSNVIEKYIELVDSDYRIFIKDFCENLKEKVDINNTEKYKCISKDKTIKIGEKFSKNITIYNCFYKYFDIIHCTAKKYVNDKGVFEDSKRLTQSGISMNSKDSHIQIWNPRFVYVSKNWKNEKVDGKFDEISEKFVVDEDKKKISDFFSDDILLRYVFSLERDEFGKVYYIFRGLYKNLDYNKKKRISEGRKWKRINSDDKDFFSLIDDKGNVSIDIKKVCELIAKMDQ